MFSCIANTGIIKESCSTSHVSRFITKKEKRIKDTISFSAFELLQTFTPHHFHCKISLYSKLKMSFRSCE